MTIFTNSKSERIYLLYCKPMIDNVNHSLSHHPYSIYYMISRFSYEITPADYYDMKMLKLLNELFHFG